MLENDNTVLIKGLKGVISGLKKHASYRNVYDRLKSKSFGNKENLAKAGVFRWVNIMNIKRYYYTFDNSLLFTESIQNTTQIFPR